jgi:hypothetical protein
MRLQLSHLTVLGNRSFRLRMVVDPLSETKQLHEVRHKSTWVVVLYH